jgi:AcrR family transcriptional regulator
MTELMLKSEGHEWPEARMQLLDAAAILFARQGFAGTRVQQITDSAGLNKAMLYYYFGSKDDIYNVLIDEGLGIIDRAVSAAEQSGGGIADRLRIMLSNYLAFAAEHPELARIVFREVFGEGEAARLRVAQNFMDRVRRLEALLGVARERGELRTDVELWFSAYSLLGMANMFIIRWVVNRQSIDVAPLVDHIIDVFMNGVGEKAAAGSQ